MMRINGRKCLIVLLLFGLIAGAASADGGVPTLPHEFLGTVTIDGSSAPIGTTIVAVIEGESCGSLTTTSVGAYGGTRYEGENLMVSGTEDQVGDTITFLIDGREAEQTATFTPGIKTRLDLSVGGSATTTTTGSSSSGGSSTVATQTTSVTTVATVTTVTPQVSASLDATGTGEVPATATVRTTGGAEPVVTVAQITTGAVPSEDGISPLVLAAAGILIIGLLCVGGYFALRKK